MHSSDDLDRRRRRALWRASHRGTKELDLIIGGYAAARLASMDTDELERFEAFLLLQDPELHSWFLGGVEPRDGFAGLAEAVRAFHGLERERSD